MIYLIKNITFPRDQYEIQVWAKLGPDPGQAWPRPGPYLAYLYKQSYIRTIKNSYKGDLSFVVVVVVCTYFWSCESSSEENTILIYRAKYV